MLGPNRQMSDNFSLPYNPREWMCVEKVSSGYENSDYLHTPRFCAVLCSPTAKGEIFRFKDFRLELVRNFPGGFYP